MKDHFNVAVLVAANKSYDRTIAKGIASFAHEVGTWSLYLEEDPSQRLPDRRSWEGDGIIANLDDLKTAQRVAELGVPVVGIGGGGGGRELAPEVPYFQVDSKEIARLAVEHLEERGFTNLAFCSYPEGSKFRWAQEREEAFLAYAEKAGMSCSVFQGKYSNTRQWLSMQNKLYEWLKSLEKPVGLMACHDVRARLVLDACRSIGARVPEEIAVIGVDNDDIMCDLTIPPLTSIDPGTQRLGYQAAEVLHRLMQGEEISQKEFRTAPDCVVTRQSTEVLAIKDEEVATAVAYIRENSCKGIQVRDVLEYVCCSRSSLEPRFHEYLGRTIHSEIIRTRTDRAKNLLMSSDLSIQEIARRTGFASPQYLTTVIRRELGVTPRGLRDSAIKRGK